MAIAITQAQINAAAASGGNALREVLTGVMNEVSALNAHTGRSTLRLQDANTATQIPPPQQANFTVTAAHGVFSIEIVNPQDIPAQTGQQVGATQNPANSGLFHEISSSPVIDFSSGVITYPVTSNTHTNISNPGVTLFWRIRSSYDGKTWNTYKVQTAAVYAGLVGSDITTPNVPLNQTNFATVDSVANGSTASVRIYGPGGVGTTYTRQVGTASPARPSGTILGLPYGTDKFVSYDGSQFQVTSTLATALPDTWEPVGKVSIVGDAGALRLPTIKPVVYNKSVIGYQVTDPGDGMTSPPTILITDTTGTGATATAKIANGQCTEVDPGAIGQNYSDNPSVTASGGVSAGSAGGGGAVGGNGGRLTDV